LREKAAAEGVLILRTPSGFAMAPGKNGEVVPPGEFNAWPEPKREEVPAAIEALEKDLEHIIHQDRQRPLYVAVPILIRIFRQFRN
jgi:hypothetical protein